MSFLRTTSEQPFSHYLRLAILGLLGLVVIATLMSLVLGASRYLRMPDGVVHARKSPRPQAVKPEDFLEKLGSGAASDKAASVPATMAGAGEPAGDGSPATRPYADEVQAMMKCAHDFAHKVGREEAEPDAAALEDFRQQLEKVAAASPERGQPWAGSVSNFVCATLDEGDAVTLAKAGKLDQPLVAAVNYHIAQWDAARIKVRDFEALERHRVETESVQESRRLEEARAAVGSAMTAAGIGFAMALALVFCLILAGIESSLRGIRDSLDDLASRDVSAVPLPVVHEEVSAPAAAAAHHEAMVLHGMDLDLEMGDPLEVEYQIPEEAISRS